MAVLGVSYGFHDATAALAEQGQLLATASEERYTRQKHDANFPTYAVDQCLKQAGLTMDDITSVYFHEDPSTTFSRVLASSLAGFPASRREFTAGMKSWFGKKLWVKLDTASRLGVGADQVKTLEHHRSHALQAFLGSGYQESAVVTVDAVGEWTTTSIQHLKMGKNGGLPEEKSIAKSAFPNSLGLFYSTITAYLGFRPMDGECSTMALAAFGQPRFQKLLAELVQVSDSGEVWLDNRAFNFDRFYDAPYRPFLVKQLGIEPRQLGAKYQFSSMEDDHAGSGHEQVYADLAASAQMVFEDAVVKLVRIALKQSGSKNLCMAGGGALNCVANARILRETEVENLYIPPDPGDGGAAVGAALYGSLSTSESCPKAKTDGVVYGPYAGSVDRSKESLDFVDFLEPAHQDRYAKLGYKPAAKWCYERTEFTSQSELCKAAAMYLDDGCIVGWVQGDFESGPRALGNRSILIRPDDPDLAKKLSSVVKDRAAFRPYALSLLDVAAYKVLDDYNPDLIPLRWMQLSWPVAAQHRQILRPALHIDGTTRPQVVTAADNPRYHELLSYFSKFTGIPGLINTSFNDSGFPIVSGPIDAMVMFARTGMDVLVVDNQIIRKVQA